MNANTVNAGTGKTVQKTNAMGIKEAEAKEMTGIKETREMNEMTVSIGFASCGIASGAEEVFEELRKKNINVKKVGCIGACFAEPVIEIKFQDFETIIFQKVKPQNVAKIVNDIKKKQVDEKLVLGKRKDGRQWGKELPYLEQHAFFKQQKKVLSKRCGIIEPTSVQEYVALDGFTGLKNALKVMPSNVVEMIDKANLRGRGGAGYPTGKKWKAIGNEGKEHYLICNADEGDPGAFMNRVLLESDPFSVIEGMIIGGYALQAKKGFIYIRTEYPLAVKRLRECLENAKRECLLGENIMQSNFSFDIEIVLGAGAFVCGEETALIESIEGNTGRPNPRPPYPTQKGLNGMPTVINNVETFANVSFILREGVKAFQKNGVKNAPGTKIFSVSGNILRTGYIEIPIGTRAKEVLHIAGIEKKLKAIHLGGPAGTCLPGNKLGTRMDYDSLKKMNAVMGSGSVIILNNEQDMVEFARDLLEFTVSEGCGKCVPCREGTKRLLEIINKILQNQGKAEDLILLEKLANTVKDTSLCGLGQSCCNPLLSTVKHFKKDYLEKLQGRLSVANKLSTYAVIESKCNACGKCSEVCPMNAISGRKGEVHEIDEKLCIKCGRCYTVCQKKAIELVKMEK